MYSDSTTQPRRQSARFYEYPARRGADLSTGPRVEVYEKPEPPQLSRRYPDSDRDQRDTRIVSRRPNRTRDSSPDDDYQRTSRKKPVVLLARPRSTSRVRIREPAFVNVDSSSDEEPRRRRKDRGDDTHIRATSRPGKKNEYAFVRSASKGRRKSDARAPVVHDLELKTDRRHKDFQSRRDSLENTEALVLVRARSRERENLVDDDSDRDSYAGRKNRRTVYGGENRRRRGTVDDSRREIILAQDDRDRDDRRRSTQGAKLYGYGKGVVVAAETEDDLRSERRAPARRRVSLSPDRDSLASSRADFGIARAKSVTTRGQKNRRLRGYDDRSMDSESLRDPRRDSAYYTDSERRAKEREREAIEREKRAIDREKAALDRERLLVDREKRAIPQGRDVPDDRRRSAADYLKQGDAYLKDGQKYYKTGQGLVSGMKNLLK